MNDLFEVFVERIFQKCHQTNNSLFDMVKIWRIFQNLHETNNNLFIWSVCCLEYFAKLHQTNKCLFHVFIIGSMSKNLVNETIICLMSWLGAFFKASMDKRLFISHVHSSEYVWKTLRNKQLFVWGVHGLE